MAITYIEIDTAQLDADQKAIKQNTKQAKKSLQNLKAELDELNGMWQGSANQAFRVQVNQDYQLMDDLLNKMDKLAECVKNAGKEYRKCESSVKSVVDSIRI